MMEFKSKFVSVANAIILASTLAGVAGAQDGTLTRVISQPDGRKFAVDGQIFQHAFTAFWPIGSKHTLEVKDLIQNDTGTTGRFRFQGWQSNGTPVLGNPGAIVADSSTTEYRAVFSAEYLLSIRFYPCVPNGPCTGSPGVIAVGGTKAGSDQDIYMAAGSTVVLTATANPGWIFTGWRAANGNRIDGFQDTVVLNGPVTVYPQFAPARTIQLATVPNGLQIIADHAPFTAPATLEWGSNTTHALAPVSPQMDRMGKWWVFASWSDGGAPYHDYTVAQTGAPITLTATYAPAVTVVLATAPPTLKLTIDGRQNWPGYTFNWGAGEIHHIEAPAQQTDPQGRIWNFAGWSNGGPEAQDLVVPNTPETGVRLTATYTPLGRLKVNSSVAGVSLTVDGAACPAPCDIQRPMGTEVHVTAPGSVPLGDGSRADFDGWSGGPGTSTDWTVTLGADPLAAQVNYRVMNRLIAVADPPEGAAWSLNPASADGFYDASTQVKVTVRPLPGYRFENWSGDLTGTDPAGVVAMSAPRAVRAMLDRVPYIAPAGVGNAAGVTPQATVAAGSIVSIFGANMAVQTLAAGDGPLPQSLGDTVVRIGDRLAPLYFVSPLQINLQLPPDLAEGEQTLVVSTTGQASVSAKFTVARNAPGLFQQVVEGDAFAVALHQDGTPVTADSPARAGELLSLYGTGFGPTDPPRPEGFAVPREPAFGVTDSVTVVVGDSTTNAENAFAAPGLVGLDVAQFRIPEGTPPGANVPVSVRIGGQDSNTVLLPVE